MYIHTCIQSYVLSLWLQLREIDIDTREISHWLTQITIGPEYTFVLFLSQQKPDLNAIRFKLVSENVTVSVNTSACRLLYLIHFIDNIEDKHIMFARQHQLSGDRFLWKSLLYYLYMVHPSLQIDSDHFTIPRRCSRMTKRSGFQQ